MNYKRGLNIFSYQAQQVENDMRQEREKEISFTAGNKKNLEI